MKKHVIKICQTAYFEFKRISSIRDTSVSQPERADHAPPVSISHTPLSVLDYGVSSWSQRVSRYRQGRSHAVFCVHSAGLGCVQLVVDV